MKLRTKTWTVVLAAMLALLGAALMIGARAFLAGFERLELAQATVESTRVLAVLERQSDDLERTARDYAEWNDTIAYADGAMPEFAELNFNSATLTNLRVHLMLVFDRSGAPVGGARIPGGEAEVISASPNNFAPFAGEVARVLADATADTRVKGFKRIGSTPWLVASAPLTTREDTPEPQGVLVLARPLDEAFLADLTQLVHQVVRIHPPDGEETEVDRHATPFTEIPGTTITVAKTADDRLTTHAPLLATDGTSAAVVHVEHTRPIHQQAVHTGWLIVAQVMGTALILGVVFSVLLSRFVVARVERLHDAVQRVGREGDLQRRVPVHGSDEIASLSAAINSMLEALARGRAERDEAHQEREKLQDHLLQAQKLEAIGEFAGGIAHDFNNCLTAITGWLSLVRHDLPKESEHREHLGLALASAHHAAAVVNQLLVYSRQGKATLNPLSLRELLGSSLQLLRSGLPRTIELQLTTTGDDDVVFADSTQIQQVVMNLVKNAADAMDRRGRVTLALDEVSLPENPGPGTDQLPPGRYARLAVRDAGPGIPPKLQERVFEPFFTTKGAGRGSGLGLAVVRSVVLRHHGSIGLHSPPGEGATFFVYLPIHRFEEAKPPAASTLESARPGRVLVVDDDPAVRQFVAKVIVKHGWSVITATDGEDAWEQFNRPDAPGFDVVLTDLTMPRLGGLQLGERIFNSGRRVPVLLMTAYATTLDPAQLRRAGFAALVAKPLDLAQLKQELAAARPSC